MQSALFIDFDNLYGCYANENNEVFTSEQLIKVVDDLPSKAQFSIKKVYLNCNKFKDYAQSLKTAGYEIINCPPITFLGKTFADQQLVVDAMELLFTNFMIEELFVLSADADFTPLLKSASDKGVNTVVGYFGGKATKSYLSHAGKTVRLEYLLASAGQDLKNYAPKIINSTHLSQLISCIESMIHSEKTVHLSKLQYHPLFKGIVKDIKCYGYKSFSQFIKALPLNNIDYHSGYLFDPNRHHLTGQYPDVQIRAKDAKDDYSNRSTLKMAEQQTDIALANHQVRALTIKLNSIAKLPTTDLALINQLFISLETGLKNQVFKTKQLAQYVLAHLKMADYVLPIEHIERVIIQIRCAGHNLSFDDSAYVLARAFSQFILRKCQRVRVSLSLKEKYLIKRWLNQFA